MEYIMPYFVKFVPYNENTLSALINKTIKFSTVYEFNDFNELGYHGTDCKGNEERFWKIFEERFDDSDFRYRFLRNASETGIYKTEYIRDFKNRLNKHTKKNPTICLEKDYQFIIENMVFSSIGVFCVSALDVFCDDSAQLMFAHYGDNLRGLALIYEMPSTGCKKIEYIDGLRISGGLEERPLKWLEGDYADMKDFIKKSKKWEYEKEYRIFDTPHISKGINQGATLRAILYTLRFSENNVDTLHAINKDVYENILKIQAIRPSCSEHKFIINGGDLEGNCVLNLFLKEPESNQFS